jgi:hypothetical protein
MRTRFLFCFFVLWIVSGNLPIWSQLMSSIYEDASGKSSINSPLGYIGLNTQNDSIKLQYFFLKSAGANSEGKPTYNRLFWGFEIVGKAENGIASLFKSGGIVPSTEASFCFGAKTLFLDTVKNENGRLVPRFYGNGRVSIRDWAMIRLGVKAAEYKLIDTSLPYSEQLKSTDFNGVSFTGSYNLSYAGDHIFGISIGYEEVNNLEDLKKTSYLQTDTYVSESASSKREVKKESQAYEGLYKEYSRYLINFDYVKNLTVGVDTLAAVNIYGRIETRDGETDYRAGVGFYWLNQKDKGNILAGVFIENSDLTNNHRVSELSKRIRIGVSAKYLLSSMNIER